MFIILEKEKKMIEEQIKKGNIEAMKNKDAVARAFYSVILNKILLAKIEKGDRNSLLADAEISNILQKTIKELTEERENYQKVGNETEVANATRQIEIAQGFLPKMLSADEIKSIILTLPDHSVPTVMKHFKQNYNGQVDMRLVQEVLKGV